MDEEKAVKKVRKISVRLVSMHGNTALVEWEDHGLHRVTIPVSEVIEEKVSEDVISAGIPYGIAWEKAVNPEQVTAKQIADALRVAGIWTKEDLFNQPNVAIGVIQAVLGVHLGSLIEAK